MDKGFRIKMSGLWIKDPGYMIMETRIMDGNALVSRGLWLRDYG